jgi:hypothetical protein
MTTKSDDAPYVNVARFNYYFHCAAPAAKWETEEIVFAFLMMFCGCVAGFGLCLFVQSVVPLRIRKALLVLAHAFGKRSRALKVLYRSTCTQHILRIPHILLSLQVDFCGFFQHLPVTPDHSL